MSRLAKWGLVGTIAAVVAAFWISGHYLGNLRERTGATPQLSSSAVAVTPTADPLDRFTYATVTERDFALMMKNPNAHVGKRLKVIGVVKQFDTATGPNAFRALILPVKQAEKRVDAFVEARDRHLLDAVVEGDDMTMFVEIAGTQTYTTGIGGQRTVPFFYVNIIDNLRPAR